MARRLFITLSFSLVLIIGSILVWSVISSGYAYLFDADELYHSHVVYLMRHGYRPYTDFFFIYTPAFHWFLGPVFDVGGFTFAGLSLARVVMIGVYILRLLLGYFVIVRLWGVGAGIIAMVLLVLDPITTFSGMQIRPDNLMLLMVILALVCFATYTMRKKTILVGLGGLCLGGALIVLLKSILLVGIFMAGVSMWFVSRRRYDLVILLTISVAVPVIVIFVYGLITGIGTAMAQNVLYDPLVLFRNLLYPTAPQFILASDNHFLFGTMGKPLPWLYTWLLLPLGAAGAYEEIFAYLRQGKRVTLADVLRIALVVAVAVQFITLLYTPSVFTQYHLPLRWLFALFGGVAISRILAATPSEGSRIISRALLIVLFFLFGWKSIGANIARSKMDVISQGQKATYEKLWQAIPENETVFPGVLFRPQTWALLPGSFIGDIPKSILSRYPSIAATLRQKRVRFLVFNDYYLSFLPVDARRLIDSSYERVSGTDIYIRIIDN